MKDLVKQANKIIGMVTFKNIRPSIVSWGRRKKLYSCHSYIIGEMT
jgi:hypothetical protein